jgi:hypothetical protein
VSERDVIPSFITDSIFPLKEKDKNRRVLERQSLSDKNPSPSLGKGGDTGGWLSNIKGVRFLCL